MTIVPLSADIFCNYVEDSHETNGLNPNYSTSVSGYSYASSLHETKQRT